MICRRTTSVVNANNIETKYGRPVTASKTRIDSSHPKRRTQLAHMEQLMGPLLITSCRGVMEPELGEEHTHRVMIYSQVATSIRRWQQHDVFLQLKWKFWVSKVETELWFSKCTLFTQHVWKRWPWWEANISYSLVIFTERANTHSHRRGKKEIHLSRTLKKEILAKKRQPSDQTYTQRSVSSQLIWTDLKNKARGKPTRRQLNKSRCYVSHGLVKAQQRGCLHTCG